MHTSESIDRLLRLPHEQHMFLFGTRGTGKSTLIKKEFAPESRLLINLLNPDEEERFSRYPNELAAQVLALPPEISHVVIDEVQKIPKLLDIVHDLIEQKTGKQFILTGSSARKLKHGGANLLAGRAFVYNLFPFSFVELGDDFNLDKALQWGLLPKQVFLKTDDDRMRFLQAYSQTYLKEEIWSEQLIKKLDPFRRFLEVSAQCNGKILNYANIARDVGVDDKTVGDYFSILEDTLIGFMLEPFHTSFRKRLSTKPKFYYIDTGIVRALGRMLSLPLQARTSAYGDIFEHFVIVECMKLASYYKSEYRFSYLKTKDDAEIDLIVERPGLPLLCIKIKSTTTLRETDISAFSKLIKDFPCEALCFSNDPITKQFDNITALHWSEGIKGYFLN